MRRGRRQRVGLASLASAVAVTSAMLVSEQRLDAGQLRVMVVTPAMLAFAALGVLALLGLRDWRRLTTLQGERMLRGIDRGSTLPPTRVQAFLAGYPTAAMAFLACYGAWRRMSAGPRLSVPDGSASAPLAPSRRVALTKFTWAPTLALVISTVHRASRGASGSARSVETIGLGLIAIATDVFGTAGDGLVALPPQPAATSTSRGAYLMEGSTR